MLRWKPSVPQLPDAATETLLREAVARAPGDPFGLHALAKHLFDRGRFAEVVDLVAPAAKAGDPTALKLKGHALLAMGRHVDASAWFEAAWKSGSAGALSGLVRALARSVDDCRVTDLCRAALDLSPDDGFAMTIEARRLFAAGQARRVSLLCRGLRDRGGTSAIIASIEGAAMARMNRVVRARALIGQQRLRVGDEPGDVDLEGLAAEILRHPNLQPPVPPQATQNGQRVNRPLLATAPLLRQMEGWLKRKIECYVAQTKESWPFGWSETLVRLRIWAVVMGPETVQDWHMHPSGIISGVFYVSAPGDGEGAEDRAGVLRFGLLPFAPDFDDRLYREEVPPRPGRLVLFPSSYAHHVPATRVCEPRISIAFDVVRA